MKNKSKLINAAQIVVICTYKEISVQKELSKWVEIGHKAVLVRHISERPPNPYCV